MSLHCQKLTMKDSPGDPISDQITEVCERLAMGKTIRREPSEEWEAPKLISAVYPKKVVSFSVVPMDQIGEGYDTYYDVYFLIEDSL
jgi:hypothetical protein